MAFSTKGTFWTTGSGATTPGTAVAEQAAHTSFSATAPLFVINNTGAAGGPSIWPAYLRLIATAVQAGTLNLELAVRRDTSSALPTNANQYTNPTPTNQDTRDTSSTSVCKVYHYLAAQAMVAPAESAAAVTVHRSRIASGVAVVGDEYVFEFGQQDQPFSQKVGLTAARATDPARMIGHGSPFVIAPGQWAKFHVWWVTEAGATTYETELAWYEL